MSAFYGIDQSFTGFAIATFHATRVPCGTVTAEADVMDFSAAKAGRGIERLVKIENDLAWYFATHTHLSIAGIAIEGYSYGSKFKREEMGELGALLRVALGKIYSPDLISVVAPGSVKKFATGSGHAKKDQVMLSVYKKWGYEAASNDVADAYTLARIAHARQAGAALAYEKDVLKTVEKQHA